MISLLSLALAGLLSGAPLGLPVEGSSDPAQQVDQPAGVADAHPVVLRGLSAELLPELVVELEGGELEGTLVLERRSLRSGDFGVLVQGEDGQLLEAPAPPVATYRGRLLEDPSSRVAASLVDGRLHALLRTSRGDFGLEPGADGTAFLYHEDDVLEWPGACEVVVPGGGRGLPPGTGGWAAAGGQDSLCEIAFDADVQYFDETGSVAVTVTRIEQLLNAVDLIYSEDVGVTYGLTVVVVRTAEPDPYTTNVASDLLAQFRDEWNGSFDFARRDVAHMMTGKSLQGQTAGVAYLSQVCNLDFAYGLSESSPTLSFQAKVALMAHELGHNFGASHCDGQQVCRIMCSSLGGCSGNLASFSATSISSITAYVGAVSCLAPAPAPLDPPFLDTFASAAIDSTRWPIRQGAVTSTAGIGEPSTGRSLNLDAFGSSPYGGDRIVSNRIRLGTAPDGQYLRYWVQHRGVEAGESLLVEYQDDGLLWRLLEEHVSDGVDGTSFELIELPLPADAYHDDFRVRLRTNVSDQNDDWFVDDVAVDDQPICPPPESYCSSGPNSFGPGGARIQAVGSTSVASNDLQLQAVAAARSQPGLFYFGPEEAQVTFGNGLRCVGGIVVRLPVVGTDAFGFATFDLDLLALPPAAPIQAGDTVHFQYWFRDPLAGGALFDLTDGLRITFCP